MKAFIRTALKVLGIFLLVLIVAVVAVCFWLARRPWPQVEGTITAAGLEAPVRVVRDRWGVPHLYAETAHDLFFAQGFVHAQDRLWQMHFNRVVGKGELGALVGAAMVRTDYYFRTLGLHRAAERDWETLDAEARAVVEAYSEGVNAFLASHGDQLPLEFMILSATPDPWTPIDTLTWTKLMSLNLGLNMTREMSRFSYRNELGEAGEELARWVLTEYPEDAPTIVSGPSAGEEAEAEEGAVEARFDLLENLIPSLTVPSPAWGSNSWVVGGSRTAGGQPILANDTHLGLPMPSVWYEIGLHGGGFDVVGFSFPGMPTVIIGHNGRIAWGITAMASDVQDLYVEKLDDAENPQRYQFRDQWLDLEVVTETIAVKGGEPQTLKVLHTHHGPIVNLVHEVIRESEPMALSWTALDGGPLMQTFVGLARATNWDEFRHALEFLHAPGLSFTYADVDGNIGYQSVGKHPIRVPGHDGTVPVPGWSGEYEWQGFIPFAEMPSAFNPEAGLIVSANNKTVPDDYPYVLGRDWAGPQRAQRITDMVAAAVDVDVAAIVEMQADTYSVQAEAVRPHLLAVEVGEGLEARARSEVEQWDLRYETDRVGASVYFVWQWKLLSNVLADEFGEKEALWNDARRYVMFQLLLDRLLAWDQCPWFDDRSSPETETRDDMVRKSLTDAVAWLVENHGEDPAGWQWGRLHTMTFTHPPLGQSGIGPVERIFNAATIPARGAQLTVNSAASGFAQPFAVGGGTSQRLVVDLGDLSRSGSANSTGQVAHAFHRHREDQIELWSKVELHPMLFTREEVDAQAEAVLTLNPQ